MWRRSLLHATAGLAAGPALRPVRPAVARTILPGAAAVLVPGPEDGGLAQWTARLTEAMARGASTAITLTQQSLGGPDGVTAANRFATSAAPDGRMLLALPGAAAHARLMGHPRARFDAAGWLPVAATRCLAVVAGRQPMPRQDGSGGGVRAALRLGLHAAEAAETAALLGLDLMALAVTPVLGLAPAAAEAALAQGSVDAVVLRGTEIPARLAALGAQAWFTLQTPGPGDTRPQDMPMVTDAMLAGPAALRRAFRAAAAAVELEAALVLPALTPADLVALWRGAAQRWAEDPQRSGPQALSGADAIPLLSALSPAAEAVTAYRIWLLRRLNWRPE